MDNPFRQPGFDTQPSSGFLTSQKIIGRVLHWLAGFIRLTEEDQEKAGIYLGD